MRRRMGRAGARREGGRWFGREGGLSLVEIVVGLAILVIALGGIYGLVSQSVRSFGVSEDFLDVQQNARVALGKLGAEAEGGAGRAGRRGGDRGAAGLARGACDQQRRLPAHRRPATGGGGEPPAGRATV